MVRRRGRFKRSIAECSRGPVQVGARGRPNRLRALNAAKLGFAVQFSPEARGALAVTQPFLCGALEV